MAQSSKYGNLEIPKIGADEPVFILRAQDQLAETAIAMYRDLAASHGAAAARDLEAEIQRFRRWNGSKKLPD
jgi:hypothetical protein